MTLALIGLFIFILGIYPNIIGMDRSPVVGFVQIGVWLTGLAMLLVFTTLGVRVVRNGRENSLRTDIGLRLIATGYVFAMAASLADFMGIGSHTLPDIYYGPVQTAGLVLGIMISLFGILLYWPRKKSEAASSPFSDTLPIQSGTSS
jgi:uncharacterized membrane protein